MGVPRALARILTLALALALLTACQAQTPTPTPTHAPTADASQVTMKEPLPLRDFFTTCIEKALSAAPKSPENGQTADVVIGGVRMQFVTEEEKETWRAPLERLLSNVYLSYGVDGEIKGYRKSTDESAPAIMDSYDCSLLDVTLDGIPELLIEPLGTIGSSGATTHYAYDIFTGEIVATFDTATDCEMFSYLCAENGRVYLFSKYYTRNGCDANSFHLSFLLDRPCEYWCPLGEGTVPYGTREFLSASYLYKIVYSEDVGYLTREEHVSYSFCGTRITAEDHQRALDELAEKMIPLHELNAVSIPWSAVQDTAWDPAHDYAARGAAMANALLSTPQKFLRFP